MLSIARTLAAAGRLPPDAAMPSCAANHRRSVGTRATAAAYCSEGPPPVACLRITRGCRFPPPVHVYTHTHTVKS